MILAVIFRMQRFGRREEATKDLETARKEGEEADVEKYSKKTVKVTQKHVEECKRLLTLMGVPIVQAPGEAEAQCAALGKAGEFDHTGPRYGSIYCG